MGWPGINPGPPTWQEGNYPPEPLSFLALFTRMSFRLQLLFKDTTVRRRQRRAYSLISGVMRISERFENFPASLINKWLVHGPFGKDALDSIRGWKTLWTRENCKLTVLTLFIMNHVWADIKKHRDIRSLRLLCNIPFDLYEAKICNLGHEHRLLSQADYFFSLFLCKDVFSVSFL